MKSPTCLLTSHVYYCINIFVSVLSLRSIDVVLPLSGCYLLLPLLKCISGPVWALGFPTPPLQGFLKMLPWAFWRSCGRPCRMCLKRNNSGRVGFFGPVSFFPASLLEHPPISADAGSASSAFSLEQRLKEKKARNSPILTVHSNCSTTASPRRVCVAQLKTPS